MKPITLLAGALLAVAMAAPAGAHEIVYTTVLSGPAEAPPNSSPASGWAKVTFDFDLLTMQVEASFTGLLGTTTASHIHCCTAAAGTGTAGVATQTPSFNGFPLGVSSGTYDFTYDMTQASSYNATFLTNAGSVSGAFNALAAGLDSGKAYFNIHTTAFPGGEIRGFLNAVPEPQTYALMAAGLAVIALVSRRRRRG
ncbi:MAG TPA: CHRD domain-containing protein [Albitalea sp.]|jgi:hypothetical protein|nr:CHRD domain-containing protein [Albitalea sp.]